MKHRKKTLRTPITISGTNNAVGRPHLSLISRQHRGPKQSRKLKRCKNSEVRSDDQKRHKVHEEPLTQVLAPEDKQALSSSEYESSEERLGIHQVDDTTPKVESLGKHEIQIASPSPDFSISLVDELPGIKSESETEVEKLQPAKSEITDAIESSSSESESEVNVEVVILSSESDSSQEEDMEILLVRELPLPGKRITRHLARSGETLEPLIVESSAHLSSLLEAPSNTEGSSNPESFSIHEASLDLKESFNLETSSDLEVSSDSKADTSIPTTSSEIQHSSITSDKHDELDESLLSSDTEKFTATNVIEIDSESESSDQELQPLSSSGFGPRSAIRLLSNSSVKLTGKSTLQANTDAISVSDLVGQEDLLESYQFNFSVDLELFLTYLHPQFAKKHKKIVFITGSPFLASHPLQNAFRESFDISEVVVPLPSRYASHHTKMMINFFGRGEIEVVIMTCNLTQLDFSGLTQAVWRSGRLQKGATKSTSGKRFRFDLLRYLSKYNLPTTKSLIQKINDYDFSSIDVELVASAPGLYSTEVSLAKSETYGYLKLRQVLERNNLLIENTKSNHNVLSQVTSIAYPYTSSRGSTGSIFSHLICPLVFKKWSKPLSPGGQSFEAHQKEFNYKPHIVFPTTSDIARSSFGYMSGTAIHFKYKGLIYKEQYEQNIKKYLCRWGSPGDKTGRSLLTPHVKYYAVDNGDNWKTLKWVLVGSHNLSKQAWGYPTQNSNGAMAEVSSYELSVLIPGADKKLVPTFASDFYGNTSTVPVRVPFMLPPTPYEPGDLPWSGEVGCGSMTDRWGNVHPGSGA